MIDAKAPEGIREGIVSVWKDELNILGPFFQLKCSSKRFFCCLILLQGVVKKILLSYGLKCQIHVSQIQIRKVFIKADKN